jgi:hypothetical protein
MKIHALSLLFKMTRAADAYFYERSSKRRAKISPAFFQKITPTWNSMKDDPMEIAK